MRGIQVRCRATFSGTEVLEDVVEVVCSGTSAVVGVSIEVQCYCVI